MSVVGDSFRDPEWLTALIRRRSRIDDRSIELFGSRMFICTLSLRDTISRVRSRGGVAPDETLGRSVSTNGHDAGTVPNPIKMEAIRSRDCQSRIPHLESGPIIQASHVTSSPVESYIEQGRSDYSGVTRKFNACKAVTP